MKRLILASASPRRKKILEKAGYTFSVVTENCDENFIPGTSPDKIVESLAEKKALAVSKKIEKGIIIAADTIVVMDNKVLGKPQDEMDAFNILMSLKGKTHNVYTGVCIFDKVSGKKVLFHSMTEVIMKNYSDDEIRLYVEEGEPMDKAGAYGIQGKGALLVEGIKGDYNNVVGLPLSALYDVLNKEFDIIPW